MALWKSTAVLARFCLLIEIMTPYICYLVCLICPLLTNLRENFTKHCARKCILLNWIMDKAPFKAQWHRVILEYVALDYLTCKLHSKDDVFCKTWEPFLSYIGLNISTILARGFVSKLRMLCLVNDTLPLNWYVFVSVFDHVNVSRMAVYTWFILLAYLICMGWLLNLSPV